MILAGIGTDVPVDAIVSIASACLVTTLIALALGRFGRHRAGDDTIDERTRILHQIASQEPLDRVLEAVARFVKRETGLACAVFLAEEHSSGRRLYPIVSIGIAAHEAMRCGGDHIGEDSGCCGVAAWRCSLEHGTGGEVGWACAAVGFRNSHGEPIGCIGVFAANQPSSSVLRPGQEQRLELGPGSTHALESAAELVSIAMSGAHGDASAHAIVRDLEARNAELEKLRMVAEAARSNAEAAVRVKGEFLANMSHEIRTPMTAILGFADVLSTPGLSDDERSAHIDSIRRAGAHLLTLINDILDLSKIEAGKMAIEQIDASPLQILADAVGMLRDRAEAKGVSIVTRCDGGIPLQIKSDPTRIRQILINLIGNAIKFTDRGVVTVRVSMATFAGEANAGVEPQLVFEVSDTGIGIDSETLGRLFTPFMQADGSLTRRFGGTGLGLAICKRLCELLGGTISAESVVGEGSSFRVVLPTGSLEGVPMVSGLDTIAARNTSQAVLVSDGVPLTGRILVADDSVDNQRLMSFHLKRAGAAVDIAVNGREAVRRALESLTDRRGSYDLILMDMQMPELDGYQATAALRARGWDRPIVALTAHAANGERERCLASGCDDFQSKPVTRDALLRTCSHWIARSNGSGRLAA
jgi:signal transduction histidine kinase/ActR/RegA family two-component response regulator